MKKQLTQILSEFNFEEALRFFRKAKPNSIWSDELESWRDKEAAEKKLKELLTKLLKSYEESDTEVIHFSPPPKIRQYKQKVNACYAAYRKAFTKMKRSESQVERKKLAFDILNAFAQIQEYSDIIRYWERTGKIRSGEAKKIDIRPKPKTFKKKPLPKTELGLYKERKNIVSYISRAEKRNTPAWKVKYWEDRRDEIDKKLKEYAD